MTTEQRKALYDPQSTKTEVQLTEISSSGISTLYLAAHLSDVVSNGNTYLAAGMRIKNPDKGSEVQSGSLQFSGIPLEYIQLVQDLPTDAEITVKTMLIFLDAPDDYLDGPYEFTVDTTTIQSATGMIEMTLTVINPLDFIASTSKYDNRTCPGMFV